MADSFLGRERRMNEFATERPRISDKRRRGREKIRTVFCQGHQGKKVFQERRNSSKCCREIWRDAGEKRLIECDTGDFTQSCFLSEVLEGEAPLHSGWGLRGRWGNAERRQVFWQVCLWRGRQRERRWQWGHNKNREVVLLFLLKLEKLERFKS